MEAARAAVQAGCATLMQSSMVERQVHGQQQAGPARTTANVAAEATQSQERAVPATLAGQMAVECVCPRRYKEHGGQMTYETFNLLPAQLIHLKSAAP